MPIKPCAQQVLDLLDQGSYLTPSGRTVAVSVAGGTRLYSPETLELLSARQGPDGPPTQVSLRNATTQEAARELAGENLVLLNFASARNPGGGFLKGARAQEEDLCRCSSLYPELLTQPTYYQANRSQKSLLYTDYQIYSPEVTFFRVDGYGPFLEEPFRAAVITAPAPNAAGTTSDDPQLRATFRRRWGHVLALAQAEGHSTLLLGAWGCGAFGNDPLVAAETVRDWLDGPRFRSAFRRVVFAIPGGGRKSTVNLETFQRVLNLE